MSYKLLKQGVKRLIDEATIPPTPDNIDWKAYLAWKAAGGVPEALDPDPPPTQDQLDATAAKAYAKLTALKAMSPAQVDAWVTANVNNLADAKDAIKTLAIAVSVLSRRL